MQPAGARVAADPVTSRGRQGMAFGPTHQLAGPVPGFLRAFGLGCAGVSGQVRAPPLIRFPAGPRA